MERLSLKESGVLEAADVMSSIPLHKLEQKERDKFVMVDQFLRQRVVGQDMAVKHVADAIRRHRAGFSEPNRPIASFLFMGPTGVGKTELAKALAACVGSALVQIHLGGPHVMAELIGGGSSSCLTEAIRRRPYSVVLFERIEDARNNNDVVNILSKLLRDGTMTDAQGRTVSFTSTFVIMTSNIGWSDDRNIIEDDYDAMEKRVVKLAMQTLRPKLMDEIDECVVFRPLHSEHMSDIVEIQLNRLKDRLKQNKNINFRFTKEAVALLAAMDYNLKLGAGDVRRVIHQMVEDEVAKEILTRGDDYYKEQDTTMILDIIHQPTTNNNNNRTTVRTETHC